MRCPQCGNAIYSLACVPCTTLASRAAILARQAFHLEDVRRGRLNFFAARVVKTTTWHLMLFGDRAHAYCGQEILSPVKHNRRDFAYAQLPELKHRKGEMCANCLKELAAIEQAHV